MRHVPGFTLIEILVVVAIIAILASVVLVGLGAAQSNARWTKLLTDLRAIDTGAELYNAYYGQYPPDTGVYGVPPGMVPNIMPAWPWDRARNIFPCAHAFWDWDNWETGGDGVGGVAVELSFGSSLGVPPNFTYCIAPNSRNGRCGWIGVSANTTNIQTATSHPTC